LSCKKLQIGIVENKPVLFKMRPAVGEKERLRTAPAVIVRPMHHPEEAAGHQVIPVLRIRCVYETASDKGHQQILHAVFLLKAFRIPLIFFPYDKFSVALGSSV
jgi:hypothetical protein